MADYTTQNNQDFFYVINKTVGDLNSMYSFLVSNPTFKIDFVPSNVNVTYTRSVVTPLQVASNKPNAPVTSLPFISKQNQSIWDVCLMTLTDLNQIYSFNVNLNDKPKGNSAFSFNPQNITDNILSKYVTGNGIVFNTGDRKEPANPAIYYLLQEDGFFLLQENLSRIILE